MAANQIGLNQIFPIYNENGTPFHDLVLRKGVVDSIVMSLGDKITGDVFYKDNTLQVTMKEYVVYNGIHYSLVNPPTIVREGMVADNGELKGMTKYSFEFYHPMCQLSNFPFTDVATKTGEEKYLSQNKTFSWIGKPQDYIDKLNKNLQGTVWYVRKSDRFPVEKDDELSEVQQFDNVSVAEAIKRGYEIWGIPYIVSQLPSNDPLYAQGKRFVVEYGLPSNEIYESESARQLDTPFVFQMGQGVGLKNNSRTPRNNKIVTRIAGYGSEDNVPYGYPQIVWTGNQDWDYTINNDPNNPLSYPIYKGIVGGQYVKLIKHPFTRTHLMPSIFTETVNKKVNPNAVGYDPTIEIKDYYDAIATQEYPYVNEINLQAPSYESHEFADIKPELDADRNTGIVSAVPLNADLTPADHWDDSMDDDGNYLQSYFQITLPQLSFDLYACAAITQEMEINMRSGACIGCTFPVQVDWDDYKRNFYDEDGNFVPDGAQRDLTKYPKSNLGQISVVVQKDNSTFGTLMPNIYQQPQANDLFVFIGISLPLSYIANAEERLDDAMKTYMLENNVYYFDYPLKFDEHFLATHTYILEQIRPNSIIHFDYGGVEQQLFVKQLTVKYGNAPLPQYDITLTDNIEVVLNQIGQVADDVEKLSSLIAILRQSYNRNVWNELAKKLSKTQDDTAQGVITFLKGLISESYTKFGAGADFGQFIQGLVGGDGARIDEYGNMEATSLVLRSFLETPKLVYNHVDVRVGDEWQTNGAGEIESVEIDQSNPLQGTIKLHLLDGEYGTIKPQDKCKGIFHHLEGYNDTETKDDGKGGRTFAGFYTSYFIALSVSGDNNEYIHYELRPTINVGGNTYWQNDQGASSGIRGGFHPSAHMVFAQYSNAADNTRQSCQYRTTTYTRMLTGMTGWDEGLENIAFQIGNTPLIASAYNVPNAGQYSLWINGDIYFSGTLNHIDSWGRQVDDYPDQGNYFSNIQYHENDLVHYDGSVWRMAIENEATLGVTPGTSTVIEGQTVYPWVKWIYADSMNPSGKWNHALVPYPANSIVNIEGMLLISKRSTSQPPIDLLTDENSEPLQIETGEYIVYSDEVNEDWELLFDVGDLTNGEDGQNAIMVNLTNDTDTVLSDEQGNVIGDLPTTTAQLYDGVTLITSSVFWTCQTVGCTATINPQGVVSITAMSADEAKVVCIATYNTKSYTKVFTFKKLYGKDKLWLEPSVDKIERYVSGISDNQRSYAYAPTSIRFKAYIQKSGQEPRELTASDGYILLGTNTTHYASGQEINVASVANLFVGNHLPVLLKDASESTQDVEDIVITEAQDSITSAGAWTYERQIRNNELVSLFGNVYRAKQDSKGVPPVELLTNENNVPLQDENGEYIAYNFNTNTTYYELWIKGSYVIRSEVMYAKGTDGTTTPTSGWSFTKPSVTYGDWLWIRTEVIRSDENNSVSYSVSYVGINGVDGKNAVRVDLDNENDSMLYDGNGTLISGNAVSHASLFDGQTKIDNSILSWVIKNTSNVTATISGNTITVTAISANSGSVTVATTYNGKEYSVIFSVKKLIGVDKYEIKTTPNAITYDPNTGEYSQNSVVVDVYRTSQNGGRNKITSLPTGYTLQYSVNNGTNWENISPSGSIAKSKFTGGNILVRLTDSNSKELDGETIPIVSDGTNGIDGENAVRLALAVSPDAIALNANSDFKTGNTLTVKIQKTDGSVTTNIQKSSTATFKLWVGSNGYDISDYNSSTESYSILLTGKNIQSDSYVHVTYVDGDINLDKSVSVTQDGSQGLQGCVTRVSEWTVDTEYRNDQSVDGTSTNAIGYIDVVAIPSNSPAAENGYLFYECKETHTSSNANKPPTNTSENNYWKKLSNVGTIYTSLLIADNAYIKFGSGNQFVITNVVNNQTLIQAGMKGDGDIRIWAGGDVAIANDTNLANAPFRVTKDGKLYATNGEFTGTIHAKSGSIDGNLLIGETLAHRYRFEFKPKEPALGTGSSRYYSAQLIGYDNDRSSEIFSIKMGVLSTIGSAVIGYEPVISIRDSFINSQRFMFKTTISSRTYTLDGSIYTNNANLFASAYNQSGVHKYMYYGIVDGVCTLSANSGNGSAGWATSASEVEVGGVYMNSNGYLVVRRS